MEMDDMYELFSEEWIAAYIGTEEHKLDVVNCDNYYFCCQDCPLENAQIPVDQDWSCYY